ncbi:protein of unknown function (plasmid) [Caballeronia sp. S22]
MLDPRDHRGEHVELIGSRAARTMVHARDRVKTRDEEAIRVANDSEFGLSAAIFSRDIARALERAKLVESGICHINGPTVHDEARRTHASVLADRSSHRRRRARWRSRRVWAAGPRRASPATDGGVWPWLERKAAAALREGGGGLSRRGNSLRAAERIELDPSQDADVYR